jgi:hypothetical protein
LRERERERERERSYWSISLMNTDVKFSIKCLQMEFNNTLKRS